jgi:2-C-methyl-D-erythritol 2,4-cyclodiphosphate synthase
MAKQGIKNSEQYLRVIQNAMDRQHKSIRNCSLSIEAARPKIDPLASRIKKNLSRLLQIPTGNIGITTHSGEKLTPFGKGEAIRCQAIVLLQ